MARSDPSRLIDIIEAALSIEEFLEETTSFDDFVNDEKSQSSALYQLAIIGEAVAHLSPELKERYSYIDWEDIKAFRNEIIHEYFGIALHIVWKAATDEAPKLAKQIESIFEVEFPDDLEFLPKRDR